MQIIHYVSCDKFSFAKFIIGNVAKSNNVDTN